MNPIQTSWADRSRCSSEIDVCEIDVCDADVCDIEILSRLKNSASDLPAFGERQLA